MYYRKMEKQTRSVKSVKTLMPPELSDDNKRSPPLPQVQAYSRPTPDRSTPTPDRSTPTPGNKYLWHQLLHSNDVKTIHLVPTDYVREIFSETSSATDLTFTTHCRPI
jgi:hypothetical protein